MRRFKNYRCHGFETPSISKEPSVHESNSHLAEFILSVLKLVHTYPLNSNWHSRYREL